MKKFLKLQAKKSMSLFLAVLMVLSCWVWVAPPIEAEAANSPDEGYYYVEVRCKLTDWASTDETAKNEWTVTHGKGTTVLNAGPVTAYNNGNNDESGNYVIASGWVPAFPTALRHVSERAKDGCNKAKGDGFRVEFPTIWVGPSDTDKSKLTCICESDMKYTADDQDYTINGWKDGIAPTAKSFRPVSGTVETWTVNVPQLGDNTEPSKKFSEAGIYDQYNVKMDGEVTYFVGDATGSTTYTEAGEGIWNEGTTVKFNANVQKNLTEGKAYLIASQGSEKGIIANIVFKFPMYTIKVDPIFTDAVLDMSGDTTHTGAWSNPGNYNTTATKYPLGTATKEGFTFKGFWTTQQPTGDSDASYNATEANFAEPISAEEFAKCCAEVKDNDGDKFVTVGGKKYYNAGRKWDPATDKTILGADNFYGWWLSKDIVIKFYDIDGSYLGTKTAKYGSTPAKGGNFYPAPKYHTTEYIAGAYVYKTFSGQWRDITGLKITEGITFDKDSLKGVYESDKQVTLSLTPIYKGEYKSKYQVNFVNPDDGSNIGVENENDGIASGKYDYRHILAEENIPTVEIPGILVDDPGYHYEFAGWTSQKPAKGNYHTVAKNDTAITENTDWVVRDEITYYAIFRSTVKEYLVNFNYTDSTGAAKTESLVVPYGSAIATPNVVNRTYATGGYGYTLEGWDYQKSAAVAGTLGADATLVFNKDNVFVTTNNLAPSGTPIEFTARYGAGQPTPYTVTFKFKDAEGKDKVITDEVYHGYAITQDTVDRVTVPTQYDDGTALYTFSNLWKVTEGTADKAEYAKDEFTSFEPVSHVTFEAIYGEGVPFYTVTYIDGANKYEERVLAGKNVPAWLVEVDGVETEYTPSKADTETGKYNFEGWFDAEQTDADFAQTNGTEYTTASIVNSDLVLYPQFKFEPFKFTIKFMNFDGTVQLAAAEVEAGKSFEATFVEAQRAAQLRATDETYSYEFIGWDHKVPDNYLCEGKDMTYTALYKPNYVYYEANWYNDASMSGDPLATTKHTYNSSVYAPAVNLTLPEAETGKTTVFAGWKYLKDGVATDYVRGMKITAGMNFYATYTSVNKAVTLTTVVGTVETKHSVEYNTKANIGNPADGYVDETNHKKFVGWYTDAAYKNAFDMANTALTADTTIYAKFETAAHSKTMKELVSAPTYYATGSEIIWCACNREETDETVEIPMLTDTKVPTGTIYLGGHSWSSTGTPAYTTDNDPISIFVNANADIVITSNDTGDVNTAYNPSGIGKGVAKIRAFAFPANTVLTADNYGAAQSLAVDVYTNDTQELNNNANFSIKVGDIFVADLTEDGEVQYDENNNVKYKALVDGESYIIYYYVNDKAGNQLNRLVRTAKFTYDNTPAEITVAGDSNAATATSTVTYCGKAVIKGIENGSTVLVNGEEVELTTSGASGTTAYTIAEAGNYVITVTDKAGNVSTKKIIVADGHDEIATSKAVTCTEDGYDKVICAVCGKVLKNETIESEGHKYSAEITVAPTCTEDGYTIKTCSVCGDEVKTPGEAKTGHTYNKDADGNVIYVTVTPATCKVKGKAEAKCTVCGEGKLEKELDIDTVNGHKYGATKVLKATCTQDGEEYQNCKYCYVKKTVKVLEKLNHVGTGTYTKVTTAPTCYAEGVETTYCKGCDAEISTAPVAKVAHTLVLVKYEGENNDDVANYPYGYMQYECKATGCTHTEGKTAITVKAEYTVTFVGAGAEGADVKITKTEGESIEVDAVADQTKASDNEYDYTFKGWKAASTGKIVKLPVKVTKDETYTAEFTATKRVYTHTFKLHEDDQAAFATIIGTYNSKDKKPSAIPTKDADDKYTYTFAGWLQVGDTTGTIVDDFTMTGDATFVADFAETTETYRVVYLNEGEYFYDATVNGGASHTVIADVPTKAYDKDNHYTFAGWSDGETTYNADAVITNITANIRLTAKYDAVKHELVEDTTDERAKAATCTETGTKVEKCSDCGYEVVTELPKVDHNYVLQEDGSKKCSVCGDTIAPDAKEVTITFSEKVADGEPTVLKTKKLAEGKDYTYTAPAKEADAQYEYTFKNWTDAKENGNVVSEKAEITVTAGTEDATYYANYDKSERTYTVTYIDSVSSGNVLQIIKDLKFGATKKEYAYTNATPTKAYDDFKHYEFADSWTLANGSALGKDDTIIGDTVFIADFNGYKHTYTESLSKEPTCFQPGTTTMTCKCGHSYDNPTGKPATGEHDFTVVIERVEATDTENGYILWGCATEGCTKTRKQVLDKLTTTITIKVVDSADKAINGAVVTVTIGDTTQQAQTTEGVASFTVVNTTGVEYEFTVEYQGERIDGKVETGKSVTVKYESVTLPDDTDNDGADEDDANKCSCSCHRKNFWGILFRLLHKFLKLFTGKISCCSCPDPLY